MADQRREGTLAAELQKLMQRASDTGLLIEAGWLALRIAALPPEAPAVQIDEMRSAFFAGAQHLFSAIMTILDPGEDPTVADLGRMQLIQTELEEFLADYAARRLPTEGSA